MATESQITANRINAQLSTGPRSDDGKVASSMNALRHGLASRGLIVLPGQEDSFEELETGLRAALNPIGILQETIFKCALESAWNLHRCRLAAAQLYLAASDETVDPLLDDQNQAQHARIRKYARQNENSMHKSLRALAALQSEIQFRHEAYPLTQEQRDDPAQFEQTPHSLSEVCNFEKVIVSLNRQKKVESVTRRNQANSSTRNIMAQIKALGEIPLLDDNFHRQANLPESAAA
jgi:hypothetical protein